jgi:hypothetical protein
MLACIMTQVTKRIPGWFATVTRCDRGENTEQHGRDREPRQTADSRGSSHDGLLSGKPDGALMLAMTAKRWGELQSVPWGCPGLSPDKKSRESGEYARRNPRVSSPISRYSVAVVEQELYRKLQRVWKTPNHGKHRDDKEVSCIDKAKRARPRESEVVIEAERAGCSRGEGGEGEESRGREGLRRPKATRGVASPCTRHLIRPLSNQSLPSRRPGPGYLRAGEKHR